MAAADDDMLFAALAVIRAAAPEDRAERPLSSAWRTVLSWLEHRLPGADKADLRQDALVKVLRYLDACQAKSPASMAAWARSRCRAGTPKKVWEAASTP